MSNSTSSGKTLLATPPDEQYMDTSPGSTAPSTGQEPIPVDPEKALSSPQDTIPNRFHFLPQTVHEAVSLFRGDKALAPFRLLRSDFEGRAKIYHTDWGFNQLILASAVFVFFTNLLPGITFASDLYVLTGGNYGAIEVVFSTGLCGIIFALFSGQPLTILGVTGPFCILSERIYALCQEDFHIPYLPFMAWACIHSAWMHWLLAIFNAHDWTMKYVTTFSTEIFSLLNSVIYFHKAVQELERSHAKTSFASFLYSVIGCIGTFLVAVTLSTANSWAPLFHKYVRMGLAEYAAAISIVIFIAMPHIGELNDLDQRRLPVSTSFRPTFPERTHFIVEFWTLPASWIFAAMLPGLIITTLFFFDVEVSTICATLSRYNIRKPGGYAWDVALLGTTTALCGVLGIPPANGLLPQAPLHSESLLHSEEVEVNDEIKTIRTVYEQRWSHLLHAIGIMLFVSPPFMHVLGLTPTSVLAGLFLYMGEQSLSVNPILFRFFHMLTPSSELPQLPNGIKGYGRIHMYTLLQIVITAGIFAITFTPGAPVFPVIIVLLVPIRLNVMNKWWSKETLKRMLYPPPREG
ncbi:hypothetical protein C7212DRAFT_350247 [Tuber magnatum]|uniref:Bicarbonate transporter-like transmembrane domain-containing protein n=1 Tax=Tuber magnatum TaxID=42249 RepID=A0A317SX63_9PEZI|nr:hypothetical protein C7212DRAFT_350247 [Tuber magnatum]